MEESIYDNFYRLEDKHWWFQGRKEIVMKLIEKYYKTKKDSMVLDIGCGTGMMVKNLLKYGNVLAMDKDARAIEYAKSKAPEANFLLGYFPENYPEGKFDLITAFDVMEHIDDDEKSFEVVTALLKPGGIFVATVPAYNFLWTAHDEVNFHKRRYSKKDLAEKIIKTGLVIRKISYYNSFLFVPGVTIKMFKKFTPFNKTKIDLGNNLPPAFLNRILQEIFSLEKFYLSRFNLPFGISLIAIAQKL
jgi:2-polyprenyl-3-methyl-5-hydroxy-6-metoxy-1,4-benzoquinol methylase